MTPRPRASRLTVVTAVLLALAVAVLLAMLARDFLVPALVAERRSPAPAETSSSTPVTTTASPTPGGPSASSSPASPSSSPTPSGSATAAPAEGPAAAQLRAAIVQALAGAPGTAHVSVRDAATGRPLVDVAADTPVPPASALKVLTAAAVLETLGPERTLVTRTVVLPGVDGSGAEVVLVGGGDSLLGVGASDPSAVSGRAGLGTLAAQTVEHLAAAGVEGPVRVSVDTRLLPGTGRNPAWPEDLYTAGYIAPVHALATYGARPVRGIADDRVEDPAAFAAAAFRSALADRAEAAGLTVADGPVLTTAAPRLVVGATASAAEVESAPVAEQVQFLLAHSDNQVAETLARVAAVESGREAGPAGVADLLGATAETLGADREDLVAADASGLAPADRMSAAALTQVLAAAAEQPRTAGLAASLPAPGTDSTLRERLVGTPAQGRVRAKTGTLMGTVSLTGTVRPASGGELVFSVVLDGIDGEVAAARRSADQVAAALAGL
ncbi:D-alanyl-D-alanine carboxypeptidase/D-alanyl-D-alanine-endopeptidase [Micrococcus sp.]|uniref:D-alanyl-D-alanine carboxypeptidase/D-alanyl-D-alanine endopeptidase n=1 Tax=Micrococcus sp. TaxID=1271 RepID=UPI002A914AB3|nr:D-alanyl-D-alanine carboxypeptidase/D-alanyl-D-alanine-endopeptidase [Micrococcus sp.]MDY6054661.1 D-alanyl-D-alanine carboxypeptidase/D-alanyl-D-alanine-endopeptidase [Micrococcus sp.]